jgi:hypothetical protein
MEAYLAVANYLFIFGPDHTSYSPTYFLITLELTTRPF